MKILGIETSCDETAAAVVEDGVQILSNVVVSQIDIFAEYGGVIPEVAARSHLEAMLPVANKALVDAGCGWDEIDAIAVTHAPGLLGSLLIGTLTARTLAILHNKPLYAVHHLKSHVYANWIGSDNAKLGSYVKQPSFPLLALVVSGGHTQILYMREHNHFEIIGTTRDDAVGECFDKVAKILGLPYPGGPAIAKAAERGDEDRYSLPHPKIEGLDFSFSGLKTAVLRAVQKELGLPISHPSHDLKNHLSAQQVADFSASFQKTAVEILLEKLDLALLEHPEVRSVVFAGGVSANRVLREAAMKRWGNHGGGASVDSHELAGQQGGRHSHGLEWRQDGQHSHELEWRQGGRHDLAVYFPEPKLSGDNGAMVGAAAYFEVQSGVTPTDPYKLNIYPRIEIS